MASCSGLTAGWYSNMRNIIIGLILLISGTAQARGPLSTWSKSFIEIRPGQSLWVETRPSQNGKPTLWLENGLTYSTEQWKSLVQALDQIDPELGLVLYDMDGMGQTVLSKPPIPYDIPFERQISDLKQLKNLLNLPGRQILAGLSYGGGVVVRYLAAYPNDFEKFIAMSPLLGVIPEMDQAVRRCVTVYRSMGMYAFSSDADIYDICLRPIVATFPLAEPTFLGNLTDPRQAALLWFKTEELYRLTTGSKDWNAANYLQQFPSGKFYLISGENDIYVKLPQQNLFWQSLPAGVGVNHLIIQGTGHKVNEEQPDLTASILLQAINDKLPGDGQTYNINPLNKTATVAADLKRSACELKLQRVP
jgi:pimeloyl-ACP methyl ester carboxylesterase